LKRDIRDYARIGLVHHMLYPKCTVDPDDHVRTLLEFVERNDIETLDCCIPYGDERRGKLIPAVRDCGKEVVYAAHLFPLAKISLGTTDPQEQGLMKLVAQDHIKMASAVGATGFIIASGTDAPEEDRPAAKEAFAKFCRWFAREAKPHGIVVMLEPFDRTFTKKYLYGQSEECVELVESLQPEVDNIGLELDMAHVPLMGESFEHAIKVCAPHLKRVHLGNCVMRDPANPWYGDKHPPMGIDGGEIDVPQLAGILGLLLQIGYLDSGNRGALVLEMQPFPGRTPEETVADSLRRLSQAWAVTTA
jgi:sugar phosphate isomerase/epimerase